MIAALYVLDGGPYFGLPGVDPWPESRDARLYGGPHPVVAHPPCARWGRYWSGGPSAKVRRELGDDGGCFASALASVRLWGGVLEHPEASHAWRAHGLLAPPQSGGWISAGDYMGSTCCVAQGNYGHRAQKLTWLYACCVDKLPELRWGRTPGRPRLDVGYHSIEERRRGGLRTGGKRLTARECAETPGEFRDLLLDIARSILASEWP
jgi:hypothetical protein